MLNDVIAQLLASPSFAPLRVGIAEGARRQWISGVRGTGKSMVAAALAAARGVDAPVHFLLTPSQERAETLFADLQAICGADSPLQPVLCPSLESLLYEETSPDVNLIRDRLSVLTRLAAGEKLLVIATPDAALHRTLPPQMLGRAVRTISMREDVPPDELAMWLTVAGYQRLGMVDKPGQFSVRGGIMDIFPSTDTVPVRLEYFGDEIDSLRIFETDTQRSVSEISHITLYPAHEVLLIPERVDTAIPQIRAAMAQQLLQISSLPLKVPGDDGKMEELLSPAERLTAKVEQELELMAQGAYFNGIEYYLPFLFPEGATLLDYLPTDTVVMLDEPEHIAHGAHRFREGLAQLEATRLTRGALLPVPHPLYLPLSAGLEQLAKFPEVALTLLAPGADASFTMPPVKSVARDEEDEQPARGRIPDDLLDGAHIELVCQPPVNYSLMADQLPLDLRRWLQGGYTIAAATHQEHRLKALFGELELPVNSGAAGDGPGIIIRRDELSEGVIIPAAQLALLTDGELLGWQKQRRVTRKSFKQGQAIASVNQLMPGDHVVHINHGIGKYTGLVRREVSGIEREFLQIDYAGADKLFVPVDQLDRVQKYMNLSEDAPEVHRLGGAEWERIKRRTKKSTEELAKQLLQLQAIRSREQGFAHPPDTPWQREMEEGFPWTETPDQLTSIQDVKADMEMINPMDRLICGDVGYGKTEVALRAAFKAVMSGKQVAVLAPTTVLAAQHYRGFRERMAAFPVRVELLSRSVPRREQTKIVGDIIGGAVDIVIGTHRILSQDIKYKELGLVIIDEEQRFGVKQKEKFKKLQANVDILTMSATPIPRTLHMALSGLREMSIINTPPLGRLPVRTMAMEADDEVLREAILRELDRDGQVFVLHNRIKSISHVAERIRRIAPQTRVEIAHGQMAEGELDQVMMDFYQNKFDVLVCTAIIENGVDFPNVNTIIVDEAEMFGLAQLYQLRGRVGRSDRQAYAYLTWKPRKKLTETAQHRIAAMKEFSALGSGYKVAMRDLEIRGAGDLLGAEQSGVLTAVGFDLYVQMLEDAVRMVKGEYIPPEREIQIDLPLDAFLPESYVPELNQRIDLYRRLAAVREAKRAEEIRAELIDRFGKELPPPVDNLFRLIAVKLLCYQTGIRHIGAFGDTIVLRFDNEHLLSPQAVRKMALEAPLWRKRSLPAPAFTQEMATIYTTNLDKGTQLSILEEIAARLMVIEEEVANAPKTKPNDRARDAEWRRFGR